MVIHVALNQLFIFYDFAICKGFEVVVYFSSRVFSTLQMLFGSDMKLALGCE